MLMAPRPGVAPRSGLFVRLHLERHESAAEASTPAAGVLSRFAAEGLVNNTGQGGGVPRRFLRDVVVLLPGLTGSVLRKDGKDLWGPSAGSLFRIALSRGRRLHPLILQEDPVELDDLGDGVVATRVFPDVHLIPGLWKIDGYSKLGETLLRGLGLVPGAELLRAPLRLETRHPRGGAAPGAAIPRVAGPLAEELGP